MPLFLLLQLPDPGLKDTYTGSKVCGRCHREIYNQWQGSLMSRAFTDPLFQGQLEEARQKAGCLTCHAPMKDLTQRGEEEGIGCDLCHSIGPIEVGEREAKAPLTRGIMSRPWPPLPHGRDNPSIRTSELCALCHHYGKRTMIENTYISWKESIYAREGITCQDCHMPIVDGKRDHSFEGKGLIERALSLDFLLLKGSEAFELHVAVTNKGAGHNLPGGTMGRQLWLVVEGYKGGKRIFEEKRLYGKVFDGEGKVVDTTLKPLEERREVFHLPPVESIRLSLLYHLAPIEVQRSFGWNLEPFLVKAVEILP